MVMAAQVGAALRLPPSTLHRGAPAARGRRGKCRRRGHSFPVLRIVTCKAKDSESGSAGSGAAETAAVVGGLAANPVVGFSLYTLKTTGCGLPPGPGGLLGGLEGVSYLAVASIVGWSLYTKAKTGSGLPNGPFGLLGAVEGVSFLSALAILVVFGLQFLDRGFIPGPLPSDQCFG